MADTTDRQLRTKLRGLLEAYREEHAKGAAILDEIDKLLAGEPGIGATLKHAEACYGELWRVRYGPAEYLFQFQQDRPALKRLIKALGLEELEARMGRYLRDADPYLVKGRHPFRLFVSIVNRYASEASELTLERNEWDAVVERLPLARHELSQWFAPTTLVRREGDRLIVSTPQKLHGEWIRRHYSNQLDAALAQELGPAGCVEFVTQAAS